MQENDFRSAGDLGCGARFFFPDRTGFLTRDAHFGDASFTAGAKHITHPGSSLRPARQCASAAELDVVGMGGDCHGAFRDIDLAHSLILLGIDRILHCLGQSGNDIEEKNWRPFSGRQSFVWLQTS